MALDAGASHSKDTLANAEALYGVATFLLRLGLQATPADGEVTSDGASATFEQRLASTTFA